MRIVKECTEEGRPATDEEKRELSKWVGWGGLSKIFDASHLSGNSTLLDLNFELRNLLSRDEYEAAKASTINAHYTSEGIVRALWEGVSATGFTGGKILEPATGSGLFLGFMPKAISEASDIRGYELDTVTGRIAQLLYPDAGIRVAGYESAFSAKSRDLVITNVPFGKTAPFDKALTKKLSPIFGAAMNLHNYFIAKGLLELREGGLGFFITSCYTMDSNNRGFRAWATDAKGGNADVVACVRLPNTAFKSNAGTQVVTDVIVFRKRANGETGEAFAANNSAFSGGLFEAGSEEREGKRVGIYANGYYALHPEHVLGDFALGGLYSKDQMTVNPRAGTDAEAELVKIMRGLPEIYGRHADAADAGTEASAGSVKAEAGRKEGEVYVGADGSVLRAKAEGDAEVLFGKDEKITLGAGKKKRSFAVSELFSDYLALKGKLLELIHDEQTSEEIDEGKRAALNASYDAFVGKWGMFNGSRSKVKAFLYEDPEWSFVFSLEELHRENVRDEANPGMTKEVKTWRKARGGIFEKRVSFPYKAPSNAGSVQEAAAISESVHGKIVLRYMAELLGTDEESAASKAKSEGVLFVNPVTGDYESRGEYLSGDVKTKLAEAEKKVKEGDYSYEANVKALKEVQPARILIGDITFGINSTWMPGEVLKRFFERELNMHRFRAEYSNDLNRWIFDGSMDGAGNSSFYQVYRESGLEAYNAFPRIVESAITMRRCEIKDRVDAGGYGSKPTYVPNFEMTEKAGNLIQELRSRFANFVRSDGKLRQDVENAYNERCNRVRIRTFDAPAFPREKSERTGKPVIHYPGASKSVDLREHQILAVQRCVAQDTLLAHQVGTGKTFTMVTAAMELRRLKLARKPMIVVHNSTLEGFAGDFMRLYPGARILVPTKLNDATARRRFVASVATGNWDCVVIPQSFIERIENDPERKKAYIEERIQEVKALAENGSLSKAVKTEIERELRDLERERKYLEEEGAREKKKKSVKDEEKAKAKAKSKAEASLERERDAGLTFEQLGVDALFVDEAHAYKRLKLTTNMNRVKGIDTSESKRAADMYLKTRYVQERSGRVVFATGTPITNTMAEVWTMMKFLDFTLMQSCGIDTFDKFASMFGEIEKSFEENPASGLLEAVDRFKKYVNVPELQNIFRQIADVVMSKDVFTGDAANTLPKLKDGKRTDIVLEQSEEFYEKNQVVVSVLEEFKRLSGKKKAENSAIPLTMFNTALALAIDPRLVNPAFKDDPKSKTNRVVSEVFARWKQTSHYKGTQLVFCTNFRSPDPKNVDDVNEKSGNLKSAKRFFGTSSEAPRFDLFEDIRNKLIAQGVPAEEIVILRDQKDDKREEIFRKTRSGEIRILLGHTEKMGVGVNVQERLYAVHHIDAPKRPMDFEQRNGRIIRQGNIHAANNMPVEIVTYSVKSSADAAGYQRLAIKAAFINAIMSNSIKGRTFEEEDDFGNNFEEAYAACSGNLDSLMKLKIEKELRQLTGERDVLMNEESGTRNRIAFLEQEIATSKETLQRLEGRVKAIEAAKGWIALEKRQKAPGVTRDEYQPKKLLLNGKEVTSRLFGAVADALVEARKSQKYVFSVDVGFGDNLRAEINVHGETFIIYSGRERIAAGNYDYGAPIGALQRVFGTLDQIRRNRDALKAAIPEEEASLKELKARKFAPFPKEKEERIRTLEKAHAEVVEKIKASEAEEAQRRNKEERGFVYFSRGNAGADKARELSAEDGRRVADALSGFIEGVNVEVLDDAAFEARLREAEGGNAFAGSEYDGDAEIEVVNIDSPLNSDEQKDTSRIKNEILKPLIGSEVEIRSDGRIVQFTRTGIESALKKRNLHRSVLNDLTRVVSGSRYFDYVEGDGQEKHKDVLGQFVYAVPVRIGEAIYRCEIKIDRLTSNGPGEGSFKQQSVFKIADVALSTGITRQGRSEANASSTTSVKVKMRELMGEVNPKNVRVPFQRIFGDEQEIGSSKELRDVSGKVYGWYEPKTKRVVLRAGARMDTALHEILGHATFDWARGNAPELYAKMREYAAGAPEEVKAAIRDAYPDVAEGSAAWEDEVFAHLIAADNEDLIRSRVLGEAGVSWLGKVRAWFGRLWRRFVRALGGSASDDLDVRAIAGMDAKAGMRRLVESALAGKRLGTWSAEARARGNVVSPERERFYSRAAEGTRRARAETASKLNEELEAWKNRYAELLSFGGMALSADARDANYERARLERAKDAESRRRAVASEAQRATAKHSGDGLDETTARQMRESRIPLLGSEEGGGIVGWSKRVCEAVKARYGLEGDAAESDAYAVSLMKRILVPSFEGASVNALLPADAMKMQTHLDAISGAGTLSGILEAAAEAERLLKAKAAEKLVEDKRKGLLELLKKYGGGKFDDTKPLTKRNAQGLAEFYLHELWQRNRDRESGNAKSFAEMQANAEKQYESAASEDAALRAHARLEACADVFAKPISEMSADEVLALTEKCMRVLTDGAVALEEAEKAREADAKRAFGDIAAALKDGLERTAGTDARVKERELGNFLRFGYSLRERFESLVRKARGAVGELGAAKCKELALTLTRCFTRQSAIVEEDGWAFERALVEYAGGKVEERERGAFGRTFVADVKAEQVLFGLMKKRAGSEAFSRYGEKLSDLQLMAQLMMLRQREHAHLFADVTEEEAETFDAEARALYERWRKLPELEAFLGKEKVALAERIAGVMNARGADIDKQSMRDTGMPLSHRGNDYFPIIRALGFSEFMQDVRIVGSVPVIPRILKPRTHAKADIDETADILSVFRRHTFDVAHYIAYGEANGRFRVLLGSDAFKEFRENAAKLNGSAFARSFDKHIKDVVAGRMGGAELYDEPTLGMLGKAAGAARWLTRCLALGLNVVSGMKQVAGGLFAFANHVGFYETFRALAKHSGAILENWREIYASDGYRARYGNMMFDRAMRAVKLNDKTGFAGKIPPGALKQLLRAEQSLMVATANGDKVPLLLVGSALYGSLKAKYYASGMSEAEAKAAAEAEFWEEVDKCQQAKDVQGVDAISRSSNDLAKLSLQFLTAPLQFATHMIAAVERAAANPSRGNLRRLAETAIHNHVVEPGMMALVMMLSAALRGDDDDEFEVAPFVLGSMDALPLFGQAAEFVARGEYSTNAWSSAGAEVTTKAAWRLMRAVKSFGDGEEGTTPVLVNKLARTSSAVRFVEDVFSGDED